MTLNKRYLFAVLGTGLIFPLPMLSTNDAWWSFCLASLLIFLLLKFAFRDQFFQYSGFGISFPEGLSALLFAGIVFGLSLFVLETVYETVGVNFERLPFGFHFRLVFQTLNEEIFFRALILGGAMRFSQRKTLVSCAAAALFAVSHFVLYRFFNPLGISLPLESMLVLFFAGLSMNFLYAAVGHIGYSWAFHVGWNLAWLPGIVRDQSESLVLREPHIFSRVLGNNLMLACAFAFLVLSWLFYRKCSKKKLLS